MKYLWLASSAIKMSCSNRTVDDLSQQQICIWNNEHGNQGTVENSTETTLKKLLTSAASTPICHYYSIVLNVINGEKL